MTTQGDLFGVVDYCLIADRCLVLTDKVPRRPNARPAVDVAILSELGAETAEQK